VLRSVTDRLLDPQSSRSAVRAAILDMHAVFAAITGVRGDTTEPQFDGESWLGQGYAVSPYLAARCLVEVFRTQQFLRGVHAAIQAARQRFPEQRLHILYPGCGPYATLILPLTTQFSPADFQVTLIDVHAPAVAAVRQIVQALGIADYVHDVIQADAMTYAPPAGQQYHLLVLEVMQGALAREPQVALTLRFLPNLVPGGVLVPGRITIDACLTSRAREDFGTLLRRDPDGFPVDHSDLASTRVYLGNLLALEADYGQVYQKASPEAGDTLPAVTIHVPPRPPGIDQFMLLTCVEVYPPFTIVDYESDVSHPVILPDLNGVGSGSDVTFAYTFGPKPGFRYHVRPANCI
jgi:hypothetical protein